MASESCHVDRTMPGDGGDDAQKLAAMSTDDDAREQRLGAPTRLLAVSVRKGFGLGRSTRRGGGMLMLQAAGGR